MTMRTGFDASFDAVEMDLLCTFANARPPFPLRVRSIGRTGPERRTIFRAALGRLAGRGLADQRGPLGVADDFVHLLRHCATTLDLTLAIGEERLGAVLFADGNEALLVVSPLDEPDEPVRLAALQLDDAVDELVRLIPELDAPMTTPFTVPRRAIGEVYRSLVERADAGVGGYELDELLSAHGIDDRLAHRLVTQLQPVLGSGQCGLAERGGYANAWRRVGEELRWLDTANGRFRLAGTSEWTSVNPLFANDLAVEIRRLAASVGR
jgi:hypothetical protein